MNFRNASKLHVFQYLKDNKNVKIFSKQYTKQH